MLFYYMVKSCMSGDISRALALESLSNVKLWLCTVRLPNDVQFGENPGLRQPSKAPKALNSPTKNAVDLLLLLL